MQGGSQPLMVRFPIKPQRKDASLSNQRPSLCQMTHVHKGGGYSIGSIGE